MHKNVFSILSFIVSLILSASPHAFIERDDESIRVQKSYYYDQQAAAETY